MKDMQSGEGKIMWIDKDSSINEWMNEWMNASINNVNIINQSISQWVGEWVSLQAFGKRMNTLIEWNSKRLNECEMIILQCD